jgi:hypothetical protein
VAAASLALAAALSPALAAGAPPAAPPATVRVIVDTYVPRSVQCGDDRCTTMIPAAPRYRVRAAGVNVGAARVALYRRNGAMMRSWPSRALRAAGTPVGGAPYGVLELRTDVLSCPGRPNAYFRVRDPGTGRWSARQPVTVGCFGS